MSTLALGDGSVPSTGGRPSPRSIPFIEQGRGRAEGASLILSVSSAAGSRSRFVHQCAAVNDLRAPQAYARYVLGLLVLVYVLNFLDRQILSILAERIKADLGLSDARSAFSTAPPSRSSTPCSASRSAAWPTCGCARG